MFRLCPLRRPLTYLISSHHFQRTCQLQLVSRRQLASLQASISLPLFLRNGIHLLPIAHIWHPECYERASVLFEGNYSSSQEIHAKLSLVFVVRNLLPIVQLPPVSNFRITISSRVCFLIPKKLVLCKLPCDGKCLWRKQGRGERAGTPAQRIYSKTAPEHRLVPAGILL